VSAELAEPAPTKFRSGVAALPHHIPVLRSEQICHSVYRPGRDGSGLVANFGSLPAARTNTATAASTSAKTFSYWTSRTWISSCLRRSMRLCGAGSTGVSCSTRSAAPMVLRMRSKSWRLRSDVHWRSPSPRQRHVVDSRPCKLDVMTSGSRTREFWASALVPSNAVVATKATIHFI
jgi:hypothetical protein